MFSQGGGECKQDVECGTGGVCNRVQQSFWSKFEIIQRMFGTGGDHHAPRACVCLDTSMTGPYCKVSMHACMHHSFNVVCMSLYVYIYMYI